MSLAYSLAGVVAIGDSRVDPLIPLFYSPHGPGLFIQIVSFDGKNNDGFVEISDVSLEIEPAGVDLSVKVGDLLVHAVRQGDACHIGNVKILEKSSITYDDSEGADGLYWGEISENTELIARARASVLSGYSSMGVPANSFYVKSILINALCKNIFQELKKNFKQYAWDIHKTIVYNSDVGLKRYLPDGLWEDIGEGLNVSPDVIVERVRKEIPQSIFTLSEKMLHEKEPTEDRREDLNEFLLNMESTNLKEERVALIFREIIRNKDLGEEIIKTFRTNSSFEQNAMDILFKNLHRYRISEISHVDLVAEVMTNMFRLENYDLRGEFLYYCALHVGHVNIIRQAILNIMEKSESYYVWSKESEINRVLASNG